MAHLLSRLLRASACVAVELLRTCPAFAQQAAGLPPIRDLGPRLAISRDTLGTIRGIRQLSDGRVMVNDVGKHRLMLFDSTLSHPVVIADSTAGTKKAYGASLGGILAYPGDSTLFVDPIALSLLVIDPSGRIVRTIAAPRPRDAPALVQPDANAAIDALGRVVYLGINASCDPVCSYSIGHKADTSAKPASSLPVYAAHDSAPILRGDVATRVIDTIGYVAIPYTARSVDGPPAADGARTVIDSMPNPIQISDSWAVTADGSVAIVRGLDYHVDWIGADGGRVSTPKIAHDWRRLSDSEKTIILDSARHFVDAADAAMLAHQTRQDSINHRPRRMASVISAWPDATELPDYYPPFFGYWAVRADADDNLWIRLEGSSNLFPGSSRAVYDIVNREGRLVDRIQLPPTLTLAGFGPGVVYLTSREGWGTVIVKYRIR